MRGPSRAARTCTPILPRSGRFAPRRQVRRPRSAARLRAKAASGPQPRRSTHPPEAATGAGTPVRRSPSGIRACPSAPGGWFATSSFSSDRNRRTSEYAMLRNLPHNLRRATMVPGRGLRPGDNDRRRYQSVQSFGSAASSAGGSVTAGLQHGFTSSPSVQLGGSLAGKVSCPASSATVESSRFAQQHCLGGCLASIKRRQQIVEEGDQTARDEPEHE